MAHTDTRARIMDFAQDAVLAKGFDATSIEEIVSAVEITKGGFFYHFSDKTELALALLERYIEEEDALFDLIEAEARQLNDDPLGFVLVGLELFARKLEDMAGGHPGCLVASAAYQDRLFDHRVRALNKAAVTRWRDRTRRHFDQILKVYEPRDAIDFDALADMMSTCVEGGIVLAKAFGDPKVTAQQLRLYRSYIKLLFTPVPR